VLEVVIGVVLTAVLAGAGFLARSLMQKLSTQDSALAESTRALAVLVARFEPLEAVSRELPRRVSTLEQATAVLRQRVDDHIIAISGSEK
jgi:hypothetical protein